MSEKFKFLEGITEADYAFEAFGKDLNELFENSASAVMSAQADVKTIKTKEKKEVKLKNEKVETLLFDFLQEIIYYKDAEVLLFNKAKVKIRKVKNEYELVATLEGEEINQEKQKLGADVKAITYHMFEVEQTSKGWRAQIILDV